MVLKFSDIEKFTVHFGKIRICTVIKFSDIEKFTVHFGKFRICKVINNSKRDNLYHANWENCNLHGNE